MPDGLWSESRDAAGTRDLYDGWAERYDADMEAVGMVGPERLAAMLADLLPDRDGPIWDFGCGTGLSGVALAEAGFTDISGTDLSPGMLAEARAKGVYRDLVLADPDAPVTIPQGVAAVTACGSICVGAAPPSVLGPVARAVPSGALFALTLNDDTIRDRDHVMALAQLQIDGVLRLERAEYGPQMPALGRGSVVTALRRL
jgi:predicted TPR repeat methyltransferase